MIWLSSARDRPRLAEVSVPLPRFTPAPNVWISTLPAEVALTKLSLEMFSEFAVTVMFDDVLTLALLYRFTSKLLELAPLIPFRMIAPPPDETCGFVVP